MRATRINLNRIAAHGLDASNCADVAVRLRLDRRRLLRRPAGRGRRRGPGQQRAFQFVGNRVFQCSGVKLLGARHTTVVGNSFRVPVNYAVFIGAEGGEGLRVSEES